MKKSKNYYQLLSVSKQSSRGEVQVAYQEQLSHLADERRQQEAQWIKQSQELKIARDVLMDSDKRQQYNRRMNGLFLCLPIEVECLVYNFLSIKELYGTLALVSRGAYELLSQAVVAIYQSHNSNNSSVSSPSVFLLYPCITLFLAAQKKLHAPLGILGRDPVLIRQFLLSGQYDAFDSILTTEAPNRQLENVIEIRHESNDEKEHQNNMIRSRIERLIREIRHSINRAQDYGGPRRDLILSRPEEAYCWGDAIVGIDVQTPLWKSAADLYEENPELVAAKLDTALLERARPFYQARHQRNQFLSRQGKRLCYLYGLCAAGALGFMIYTGATSGRNDDIIKSLGLFLLVFLGGGIMVLTVFGVRSLWQGYENCIAQQRNVEDYQIAEDLIRNLGTFASPTNTLQDTKESCIEIEDTEDDEKCLLLN